MFVFVSGWQKKGEMKREGEGGKEERGKKNRVTNNKKGILFRKKGV